MNESDQKEILKELKDIKKLLVQNLLAGQPQIKQVEKLDALSFRPIEIAELLGTTSNTVNVSLARIRKPKKAVAGKEDSGD